MALMGGRMHSILKRLLSLEVRKRRRWRGKGIIYAVVRGFGKHEVDNIGLGGLSFHYSDEGKPPAKGAYGLSIRTRANASAEVKLKGRTVSDQDVGELVFQNKKIKRCSVRFEPLNQKQKAALKSIIKTRCKTI
jgi:hypothetical protein